MFGFFRSRVACPVTSEARGWIEQRMAWLTEEFGCKRVQSVRVILPTPEFFPDPYNGTREDALRMLERVCGYMGIEPETVESLSTESATRSPTGNYGREQRDSITRKAPSTVSRWKWPTWAIRWRWSQRWPMSWVMSIFSGMDASPLMLRTISR